MKINSLPESLFRGLHKLEIIRFIQSNLTRILPNQFENLRKLKIVHLQENQLSDIPYNTFSRKRLLKNLDLSSNNLSPEPNLRFTKGQVFEKLQELDLSNNSWTAITDEFQVNFLKMRVLNLSHNLIGEDGGGMLAANHALQFLQKEIIVDLSYNKKHWFDLRKPQYSDHTLSNKLKINLTGNPFICDCMATELKQKIENKLTTVFRDKFELVKSDLECINTDENSLQTSGKLLTNVEYEHLVCPFPSARLPLNCTDRCSCSINRYFRETIIDCSDLGMTEFPSSLVLEPSLSNTICLDMSHNMITDLSKAVER